jgi:hypothetical protein
MCPDIDFLSCVKLAYDDQVLFNYKEMGILYLSATTYIKPTAALPLFEFSHFHPADLAEYDQGR